MNLLSIMNVGNGRDTGYSFRSETRVNSLRLKFKRTYVKTHFCFATLKVIILRVPLLLHSKTKQYQIAHTDHCHLKII